MEEKRPLITWGTSPTWKHRSSCHMFADTIDELHVLAGRIGLRRAWFQEKPGFPHYDLTESKRRLAIAEGVREVGRREMVAFMRARRVTTDGPSPATPVDCTPSDRPRAQQGGGGQ
jgi:hypothetical protein